MMIESMGVAVIVATAFFLLGLGVTALVAPSSAQRFLLGFASSLPLHVTELAVRILVAAAFWVGAERMAAPLAFQVIAAVLVTTTLAMAVVPWQWHRQFASRMVPKALRFTPWLGAAALLMGLALLAAVTTPAG